MVLYISKNRSKLNITPNLSHMVTYFIYLYSKKLKMSICLVTYIRRNAFELSEVIHPYIRTPKLSNSRSVLHQIQDLFCTKFCAQILCSSSVLKFCAQILCSNSVLKFSAQILCSNSVLKFCAQVLCSNSVLIFCAQIMCTVVFFLYTRPFFVVPLGTSLA